jgi:hypothetical protein
MEPHQVALDRGAFRQRRTGEQAEQHEATDLRRPLVGDGKTANFRSTPE